MGPNIEQQRLMNPQGWIPARSSLLGQMLLMFAHPLTKVMSVSSSNEFLGPVGIY